MVRSRQDRVLDPWGHLAGEVYADEIAGGVDVRPTIAVTKARLNMPEILAAMGARRLAADGGILHKSGDISVTKIAVDPVWHLPGVAARFGVSEGELRRTLLRADRRHVPGARHAAGHERVPAARSAAPRCM
jgi:hypothetical protein